MESLNMLQVQTSNCPEIPSKKMKEYHCQLMEQGFAAAKRACIKQVNKVQSLLAEEIVGIGKFQRERGKLEARKFTHRFQKNRMNKFNPPC